METFVNWVKSAWLAIRIFALVAFQGKILVGWGQMELSLRDFFGNARFGRFENFTLPETNQKRLWKFRPKLTLKGSHFPQMLIFSGALAMDITSIFHSVHLATWLCYQKKLLHLPKTKDRKNLAGKWPRICVMKNWWLGPDGLHMFQPE